MSLNYCWLLLILVILVTWWGSSRLDFLNSQPHLHLSIIPATSHQLLETFVTGPIVSTTHRSAPPVPTKYIANRTGLSQGWNDSQCQATCVSPDPTKCQHYCIQVPTEQPVGFGSQSPQSNVPTQHSTIRHPSNLDRLASSYYHVSTSHQFPPPAPPPRPIPGRQPVPSSGNIPVPAPGTTPKPETTPNPETSETG